MRDRIRSLEKRALDLEPGPDLRDDLARAAVAYAHRFVEELSHQPAYRTTEDKGIGIYESPFSEQPASIETLLELFDRHVVRPGLNPASGGHLGYIPGGGVYPSAWGDYLAAVTNRYAGVFFSSPGAVRMEHMLLRWMADLVDYPASMAGNLTSGGSIANLVAIVTARDALDLKARDFHRAVVYLTHQAHHCLEKGLRIAGLGESVRRFIATDQGRMNVEALDRAIRADREQGLLPWLVLASAGTTDTGVVDPLPPIAEMARRHGLWLHVDGAYGAFFALCDEGRKALAGMGLSDSIVMDPHKGLFLPYGSGAVLVRDGRQLANAHHYLAHYMQDTARSTDEPSPADLSPELTKHFRGPRLWLPLKLLGLAPFRAALEEKMILARYFHQELAATPGFEVGPPPELSVVTFRYLPRDLDADAFNRSLIEEVQRDGRVFLSSTLLEGRFILRLAVLSFRTHLETIDLTLDILKEKARRLEGRAA